MVGSFALLRATTAERLAAFAALHADRLLQPPLAVCSAALEAGGNGRFSGCICVFVCVQMFAGGVWWLGRIPPAVGELLRLSAARVQLVQS